jgi:ABC-type sugar transport system ATPase subunit
MNPGPSAIETACLGKRYGSQWALQDCSVSVPRGRISALVGSNGAGKTTPLKILAGLSCATTGEALVLGRAPRPTSEFLASIGYLAQDVPLYRRLTGEEHLRLGARLNSSWDPEARVSACVPCRCPWTARWPHCRAGSAPRSASAWPWPKTAGSAARRAGRGARPAGPARVPGLADHRGCGQRPVHPAVLPPAARPGTRVRSPDPARCLARNCAATSTTSWPATGC